MKEQFINTLESLVPNYKSAKFLLAVSGGIDSSVMTHLFYSNNLHFDIAHCNFHLRGNDSNMDMEFVKNQLIASFSIKGNRIPNIWVREFDTFEIQKNSGSSIEMIARDLRYNWFKELSPKYDFICTAHHANDNAETLLLNLVRGTGYKGLNGIPVRNQLFIRPLLDFNSDQIKRFADQNKIPFRVDLSNLSDDYQRNKIRNKVIPVLEQINPNLIHTMNRNIKLFSKQFDFYQEQISKIKSRLLKKDHFVSKIEISELLKEQSPELVLYEILSEFQFNYSTTEQIFSQILGESGRKYFSENFILLKDRDALLIYPKKEIVNEDEITIFEPDDFKKLGFEFQLEANTPTFLFERNPSVAFFDLQKVHFPLLIRSWQEGDYFYPFGMKGKKKLSDLFTDLKLNLIQKQQVRILCEKVNPAHILWIIGVRSDDRYKVVPKTNQILTIKHN